MPPTAEPEQRHAHHHAQPGVKLPRPTARSRHVGDDVEADGEQCDARACGRASIAAAYAKRNNEACLEPVRRRSGGLLHPCRIDGAKQGAIDAPPNDRIPAAFDVVQGGNVLIGGGAKPLLRLHQRRKVQSGVGQTKDLCNGTVLHVVEAVLKRRRRRCSGRFRLMKVPHPRLRLIGERAVPSHSRFQIAPQTKSERFAHPASPQKSMPRRARNIAWAITCKRKLKAALLPTGALDMKVANQHFFATLSRKNEFGRGFAATGLFEHCRSVSASRHPLSYHRSFARPFEAAVQGRA
jgi:hypothetical protein